MSQNEKGVNPLLHEPCHVTVLEIDFKRHKEGLQTSPLETSTYANVDGLRRHLGDAARQDHTLRIISLQAERSLRKLNVSKDVQDYIVGSCGTLQDEFGQIASCFQNRSEPDEEALCSFVDSSRSGNRLELCYLFKYAHLGSNPDLENTPRWNIRQTGVYQSFNTTTGQTFVVLLNPCTKDKFQDDLRNLLTNVASQAGMPADPFFVHNLLFSTFLKNWRGYMLQREQIIRSTSTKATSYTITEKLEVDHQSLMTIRRVENQLLPIRSIVSAFFRVIEEIDGLHTTLKAQSIISDSLRQQVLDNSNHLRRRAEGYLDNTEVLIKWSQGTAQMIADSLNFKNEFTLHELTKSTVNDSTTIRVITFVTLLYLPFSFVATICGSNFIDMDYATRGVRVSPKIWIYFAISVPLTVCTLVLWKWQSLRRARKYQLISDEPGGHESVKLLKRDSLIFRPGRV